MKTHAALPLLMCAPMVTACFQELDSGAADVTRNAPAVDPNAPPTTAIEDPAIQLDPADESASTDDPCVKTANDAHAVLRTYCASCHDQGETSSGVPRFDFVLNDERLIREIWTVGTESRRFVLPGDPDGSWVYRRPLLGTMPPIQTDLRNPDYPRPTFSDLSVLREWISSCVGPPKSPDPVKPLDGARFNFESGLQGWIGFERDTGQGAMTVAISTSEQFAGAASLSGHIESPVSSAYFMEVQNPTAIAPGTRISYHVFLPEDALVGSIQPYVIDEAGVVTGSYWLAPLTGAWTNLEVSAPTTGLPITKVGVEYRTSGQWSGTVYLDSVDW